MLCPFLDGKHQFYTIDCGTRNMLNVYKHPIREGQRGEVYEFCVCFLILNGSAKKWADTQIDMPDNEQEH